MDDLLQSRSADELIYAAEVSTRMSGNRNIANIIKNAKVNTKVSTAKTICEQSARCLSSVEALAYYVDSKSTTHAYKMTRKWSIQAGHKVFPSFYSVRKAKSECYPNKIDVDETRAEIKVQAILDKSVERLILANQEVLSSLLPTCLSFTLISKWGCDGSSGHSTYKQNSHAVMTLMSFCLYFLSYPSNYGTKKVTLFGRILDLLLRCIVVQLNLFFQRNKRFYRF